MSVLRQTDGTGAFYQIHFGPAVMAACGFEFKNLTEPNESLKSFLSVKSQQFSCEELPAKISTTPLNKFQKMHLYLIGVTAIIWKITGQVDWNTLDYLKAFLFAVTIVLTYGLSRTLLGYWGAVAIAVLFAFSSLNLIYLEHLRDYSKAPFLLAVLLSMAYLIRGDIPLRKQLWIAASCGVVLGIGLGFRTDLLLMFPIVLIGIALFSRTWNFTGFREKILLIFSFLLVATFVGYPYLQVLGQGGGNTAHVILLGLAPDFDRVLKVAGSGTELLERYNDGYVMALLSSWTGRHLELDTPEYEQAGWNYLMTLVSYFPHDFFVRYVSAVWRLFELAPQYSLVLPFEGKLEIFYSLSSRISNIQAATTALFAPSLVMAWGWTQSKKATFFAILVILGIFGSQFLQFDPRHYFYLQAISLLIFALCLRTIVNMLFDLINWKNKWEGIAKLGLAMLVTSIPILVVIVLLKSTLGRVQDFASQRLINSLEALPLSNEDISKSRIFNGVIYKIKWPEHSIFEYRYLKVEFDISLCKDKEISMFIGYKDNDFFRNFNRNIVIDLSKNHGFFVPVFNSLTGAAFDGLYASKQTAHCIKHIAYVSPSIRLPLLVELQIPMGDYLPRRDFNGHDKPEQQQFRSNDGRFVAIASVDWSIVGINNVNTAYYDPIFQQNQAKWELAGKPLNKYAYLIKIQNSYDQEMFLQLEGVCFEGSILVGLISPTNQWAWIENKMIDPGQFRILLRVAKGHSPVILNNDSKKLNVSITSARWFSEAELANPAPPIEGRN